MEWCRERGIAVANAPGCNAPGVAQYVIAALMEQGYEAGPSTTLGIVGAGHVGKIVEQWARGLGMRVLICDPPRARAEGGEGFCSLDYIAREADVITFHTPLTHDGPDATFHILGSRFLSQCERRPLLINAARGAVADTAAIIEAVKEGIIKRPVIDCWEGSPLSRASCLNLRRLPHPISQAIRSKGR